MKLAIIVVVALSVAVGVAAALIWWVRRGLRSSPVRKEADYEQGLASLRQLARGEEPRPGDNGRIQLTFDLDGRAMTASFLPPAPKRSAMLTFTTSIERMFLAGGGGEGLYRAQGQEPVAVLDHRPEIFLRRENGLDRLGKRLGINREVETGDAKFDHRVYVRSETEQPVVEALLAPAETRAAVLDLVESGFIVYLDGPRAVLSVTRVNPEPSTVSGEGARWLMTNLAAVAGRLPVVQATSNLPRPNRGRALLCSAYVGGLLGLVAMLIKTIWSDYPWHVIRVGALLGRGALWGMAAWALVMLLFYLYVRGRSHAMSYLVQAAVTLSIGLSSAGALTAYAINGALDRSGATTRQIQVLGRRAAKSDNGTTYYLRLRSWIPQKKVIELEVGWGTYTSFKDRHSKPWLRGAITTHAGYLGYSWVTEIRRLDDGT